MKVETVLASKGTHTFTISPDASMADAVRILEEANIGAVIVVDANYHPFGIVSERDVVRGLARGDDVLGMKVADLMTSPIITGVPADDVEAVLRTMTLHRFRHLPVLEHNRLIGVVTIGDLVKAELAESRGTIENLELQLMNP